MSLQVNVSIETSDEYRVQEISYDGTEKYQTPLSMSENLTRLAQKIDFEKIGEDDLNGDSADNNESSVTTSTVSVDNSLSAAGRQLTPAQGSLWPWDGVRNKLRSALTEISVLLDVLTIAKEKSYLVLDPILQESPEQKPIVNLVAKKKAFVAAASIITQGVEKIRQSKSDATRSMAFDFHGELMTMRQNWRLRRAGASIIGDLSYRSAGSWYPHPGTFEVAKNETSTSSTHPSYSSGSSGLPPPVRSSALKVKIPGDLEGLSYIYVSIVDKNDTLTSGNLSLPFNHSNVSNVDLNWQQKLENAQNVLFCKELFAKLAQEAVQIQTSIPSLVVGNKIIATLFPGIQLCIGLCHQTFKAKKRKLEKDEKDDKDEKPLLSYDNHRPVLEHSLHQLLREIHYKALHHPMPHPATATLGMSRKRYFAGPEAYDKHTLLQSFKNETMLEQIIAQAQHVVLRAKTSSIIDSLAKEIKDPIIIAHWACLNSPTKSSVKLNMLSYGYESLYRVPVVIHVGTKTVKVISRDGRTYNLTSEIGQLRFIILSLISQQVVHTLQSLSKVMGWKTLSFTTNSGVGPIETVGNSHALLIASPSDDRIISIRHGAGSGVKVAISASARDQDFYPSSLVKDRKWQNLNTGYKEVDFDKLEGKNLINKIEYLLACATTSSSRLHRK